MGIPDSEFRIPEGGFRIQNSRGLRARLLAPWASWRGLALGLACSAAAQEAGATFPTF